MAGKATVRGKKWEKDALAYDPFAGDRDVDVRVLRDKIVTARKAGDCEECGERIEPGSLIRTRAEICDGVAGTFRFCTKCCDAMALSWTDNGEAIEKRYAIRYAKDHPTEKRGARR